MNAETLFQAVQAFAVVIGVGFAVYEVRKYRSEVSIDLVDDFFSGPIVVSWRKLQGYFFDERRTTGRETIGEWFQWLAERFAERETSTAPVPAHVQYRDWRPR
jgi:hypothetical protein